MAFSLTFLQDVRPSITTRRLITKVRNEEANDVLPRSIPRRRQREYAIIGRTCFECLPQEEMQFPQMRANEYQLGLRRPINDLLKGKDAPRVSKSEQRNRYLRG